MNRKTLLKEGNKILASWASIGIFHDDNERMQQEAKIKSLASLRDKLEQHEISPRDYEVILRQNQWL